MSDKTEIRRQIRKWCSTEMKQHLLGCAVNLETDNSTLHIALRLRTNRTPEINNKITELRDKFPGEILLIEVYERTQKKGR